MNENFEFCTQEHVDNLQSYIEREFVLDRQVAISTIQNILCYVSDLEENDSEKLLLLEDLLDGLGLTKQEIVDAVNTEAEDLDDDEWDADDDVEEEDE